MKVIVNSTSGRVRFASSLSEETGGGIAHAVLDMRPKEIIEFIKEAGHQCILDWDDSEETMTIEVYDDYRE